LSQHLREPGPDEYSLGVRLRRIGLLTFHRPINYGSYWQARLLAEELARRGLEVEILDHDSAASRTAERRLSLEPTLPCELGRKTSRFIKRRSASLMPLIAGFLVQKPSVLTNLIRSISTTRLWSDPTRCGTCGILFSADGLLSLA